MWSLARVRSDSLLIPTAALAADKPFGLERRIPWNDSRVAGSPDPLPPYKVVRVFPKLSVKQPLVLTPEPGTNRLFILQHLNVWAGPGRLLAVPDRQDVTAAEAEMLIEIDGLAIGFALHPDYERNGYIYFGLNGPIRRGRRRRRWCVTRSTASRRTASTRVEVARSSSGPPTATMAATWPSATTGFSTSPRVTAPAAPTPT